MKIIKKVLFPMGRWRQTFATLIVNLMSVHLGVILGDFMTNNRAELKLFMFKDMNETKPPPICESRLEYDREFEREYLRDGFVDFFKTVNNMMNDTEQILSEYDQKYIRDEGVYFAEWMQRVLVFCIGAVMPLAVYIGHRFGKKKALSVSAMLFVVASLPSDAVNISREIPSIGAVMIFGVACAFQVYNVSLYVDEISSNNRRGPHKLIQPLLIVTGLYFNTVKPDQAKTFMAIIFNPLVPVLFLIGLQIFPESPMWLAEKNKFPAARRAYDWFQIYKNPSTKLEAVTFAEESTHNDVICDESARFIQMFRFAELKKGIALMVILCSAFWMMNCCSLIRVVNEQVDNWGDLGWIILITILSSPLEIMFIILSKPVRMEPCRIEPRQTERQTDRKFLIFVCIGIVIVCSLLDVIMLPFKKMSTVFVIPLTSMQSALYGTLVGFPSAIAAILIPQNISIGVYVSFMIGSWTISWILAETWWWLKLTTDINYWSFGYVALFVCLLTYVSFFFTDPEEPKKCNNSNKKIPLEAKETVVGITVPNENILSDTKETIPCTKGLEPR